jgi:hypothetical protein
MKRRHWAPLGGLIGLLAVGAVTLTLRGRTQEASTLVVRLEAGNVVSRVALPSGRQDTIYRSAAWSVRDLTVSPAGRQLALIEVERVPQPRNRLVVLDSLGTVLATVDRDVQAYEWCCTADGIAFVTGRATEVGVGFVPDVGFVYDVSTGAESQLPAPGGIPPQGGFYAVRWAAFDSLLYLKTVAATAQGQRVFQYDVSNASLAPTDYRDFRFSPSGRHYLYYGLEEAEEPGWHLYQRESGGELDLPEPSLGSIQGWAYREGDFLLLARTETPGRQPGQVGIGRAEVTGYVIYDVDRGTVVERLAGTPIPGVVAPRGILALGAGDEFRVFVTPP